MVGVSASFGRVIRQLREQRGWSQEQLAHRAELNRSYMGEIERATAIASLATAAKLAQALDLPLRGIDTRVRHAESRGCLLRPSLWWPL